MKTKQLPQGWKEVELKEVGKIITGNTPSKNNSENYGDHTPWIKPPDLDKERYVCKSEEYLSNIGEQNARLLPAGSVLVSCIGNIGKAAISGCDLCTNQQINSIVPNEDVSGEFLYYSIKKNQKVIEAKANKAVVPLLNKTEFSKIKIPLPPLPLQKKIVQILEQAEQLKQKREQSDKLMDDYLKSVFNEMFVGKDFYQIEINQGLLKTENKFPEKDFPEEYFEYVDIASIDNKTKKITETKKILGKDAPSRAKQLIKFKDILISTVRPNLNAVALVQNRLDNQICSTGYCILRADNKTFISEYLFFISQTDSFVNFLIGKTRGANYPAVSNNNVKSFKIPLPPLPLQEKFASIVEKVEKIKTKQKQSSKEINNLFNALMQKAFRGELVR